MWSPSITYLFCKSTEIFLEQICGTFLSYICNIYFQIVRKRQTKKQRQKGKEEIPESEANTRTCQKKWVLLAQYIFNYIKIQPQNPNLYFEHFFVCMKRKKNIFVHKKAYRSSLNQNIKVEVFFLQWWDREQAWHWGEKGRGRRQWNVWLLVMPSNNLLVIFNKGTKERFGD